MRFHKTVACASLVLSVTAFGLAGCNTEPKSPEAREVLHNDADNALDMMKDNDPDLGAFMKNAYGYAIFPDIGTGALGIGAAYGHGLVYEQGSLAGYADVIRGTIGLQAGGAKIAELVVFENKDAFDNFTNNKLTFEAGASAVILKSGVATAAKYTNHVAVFVKPEAGAMAGAQVGGQRFTFKAKGTPE